MFSGKTEELIRRLKRAEFAHLRTEIFKPRIDVRYSEEEVVSHDASSIRSTPVDSAQNILLMTSEVDVVGIDEAQFFDDGLVMSAASWPTRGFGSLSRGWTWTSRASRSGRCPP